MTKLLLRSLLIPLLMSYAFGQAATFNGPLASPVPNETSTGTVVNELAYINSAGQAIKTSTTTPATQNVFIVVGNAGITGNALPASGGLAQCFMDASITSGGNYFVVNSTITNGYCHPAATVSNGAWVVGFLYDATTTSGQKARVL